MTAESDFGTVAAMRGVQERRDGAVRLAMLLGGTVFVLMMLLGLVMRLAQGGLVEIDAALFYRIMTAHGAGMVGTATLTGATILWFFTNRHVPLLAGVFWAFLGLFLLGVVFILAAIFVGGYGGAWTFLYPLPAMSGGFWQPSAAALFLLGYVSIGVGFLLLHLEVARKLIAAYGGIGGALAWPLAFGRGRPEDAPPAGVVAAMASTIFNVLGIVVGAAVLVASIVNLLVPGFTVDALLAKNMIYFFGHVFINAAIYMGVIAVYEIIPEYTGRPWKTTRAFAIAWTVIMLFTLSVYPHHLMQDLAMPAWTLVMGQLVSYFSGIPLIAVTAFSLLVYIRGADMRWDLASALLVLGVAGWSVGTVPAIIDGMIVVNKVMHNTQWVPGHFHTYLLLGEVAMAFGFMAWLTRAPAAQERPGAARLTGADRLLFLTYAVGGTGFVLVFLVAGALSVPRRWAVHATQWMPLAQAASVFAALVILAVTVFVLRYLSGLIRQRS
ncbi:cbb3-type cytochrome c oxidase subunit I [Afifella pfennigii]|uniref:cbb3-type cytochrome c oxidase subunit I n=1 Tax=Afifella pfennigii TaxID=209897 RepID=UPI0005590B79|nr:cbb3-type cytochrome c oxidase subunit I [Afifella pfennigii]